MKHAPKFLIYKAADGWRWSLKAGNGQIVASGEAHDSPSKARRAVATVKRLAAIAVCGEILPK